MDVFAILRSIFKSKSHAASLAFYIFLKDIEIKHNNKSSEIYQILIDEGYFNKSISQECSQVSIKRDGWCFIIIISRLHGNSTREIRWAESKNVPMEHLGNKQSNWGIWEIGRNTIHTKITRAHSIDRIKTEANWVFRRVRWDWEGFFVRTNFSFISAESDIDLYFKETTLLVG